MPILPTETFLNLKLATYFDVVIITILCFQEWWKIDDTEKNLRTSWLAKEEEACLGPNTRNTWSNERQAPD